MENRVALNSKPREDTHRRNRYAKSSDSDHGQHIREWMRQTAGLSSNQMAQLFERAIGALWNCAYLTLGDLTLLAILERVLDGATEEFPLFATLKLDADGVNCTEFRERATDVGDLRLAEAIQFILVELLTVIGNLTAEVLTPTFYSELSKVTVKDADGRQRGGRKQ